MSWRYGFDWYQNHWYRFSGLPVINIGHISGRFKSLWDGAVGSAESPFAPRMVRYTYSTDIEIKQASDGTESNGMGISEAWWG